MIDTATHAYVWQIPTDVEVRRTALPARDAAWAETISRLRRWPSNRTSLVDQGAIPPSVMTIRFAIACAVWLQDNRYRAPDFTSADGDGGIIFEWNDRGSGRVLEVPAEGIPEMTTFHGNRVVDVWPLDLQADEPPSRW
jgi:hypothetical protein